MLFARLAIIYVIMSISTRKLKHSDFPPFCKGDFVFAFCAPRSFEKESKFFLSREDPSTKQILSFWCRPLLTRKRNIFVTFVSPASVSVSYHIKLRLSPRKKMCSPKRHKILKCTGFEGNDNSLSRNQLLSNMVLVTYCF